MNVLEKILEEMENESKLAHEEMQRCARGNPLQFDEVKGYARAMEYVVDTIRSHMDEIPNCEGCSRRKWYQKGFEDGKKDNDWIPVEEKLPEESGYYLAQLSKKLPNEDYSDRVVVLYDGTEKEFMCYAKLIIAWQPLPETYKDGRER
jgi:hypothetical protein